MEGLEVPAQENVDAFLPAHCGYAYLDPDHPQALDPMTPGELLMKWPAKTPARPCRRSNG